MATVLETHTVSPTAGAMNEQTLNLTFFDMFWIPFYPLRRILFYDHPCSKSEFLNTIIPKLKHSLSRTLKIYLPAAGNLLFPKNTDKKPVMRYASGDSIQLIVAESGRDFDELTAYHARDADQFYDFIPKISIRKDKDEYTVVPLITLQATLLPGRGICLGMAHIHCLGDGRCINSDLLSAWASINKHGGDDGKWLPNFDRSLIIDTLGIDSIFWEAVRQIPFGLLLESLPVPTNRVRATYTLQRSDIEKLKQRILARKPGLIQVSSFVATVTYVWSCLAKCGNDGYTMEQLVIPIDSRGRLKGPGGSPVPDNYFGNCLALATAIIPHEKLVEDEEGFVMAAEAVSEEIRRRVEKPEELLKGAENWLTGFKMCESMGVRICGITGSPRSDLSQQDFGWGKAKKMETLTLDEEKFSLSLCNSKQPGSLEYGVSLTREKMEAFASVFARGLTT